MWSAKSIVLRFIPTAVFLWLLPLQMIAQPRVARHLDLGVTGGVVMSSYTFKPTVTQNQAMGYTAGIAARYVEEKYFGLQMEVLLTRRGWDERYELFPQYKFQRSLTYLEIPVLAHIYFNLGKHNEISVDLGPKFGTMLWENTESNLPDDFGQEVSETANYESFQHDLAVHSKFDYGIQVGLGYEFKVNSHLSFQLSGRYYFGLGNIFPDKKTDVFETSSNQQIQIVFTVWWKKWIGKRGLPPFKEDGRGSSNSPIVQ